MKVAVRVLLLLDAVLLAIAELMYLPMHVGSVAAPVTALAAAATMPWLVFSSAGLGGEPLTVAAPLVAWLATIGILGVGGPGRDLLFPDAWRTALLLGAGILSGCWALRRAMNSRAVNGGAGG